MQSRSPYEALVARIYSAAASPAIWSQLLAEISSHFDAMGANIMYQRTDGSPGILVSPSMAEPSRAYVAEGWYQHDVVAQRFPEYSFRTGRAIAQNTEVLLPGERESLPIYTDFYRRYGLGQITSISLLDAFGRPAALGLHRSSEAPPYSDQSLDELARLGAHLEAALRISIELIDRQIETALFEDVFLALSRGIVILAQDGTVRRANALAEAMFTPQRLQPSRRFSAGSTVVDAAVGDYLAAAGVPTASQLFVVPRDADPSIMFQIIPIDAAAHHNLGTTAFVVVATETGVSATLDPNLLRQLYGLTPAEALLAANAVHGSDIAQLAAATGIAPGTAKLVLQRIYKKAGVRRYPELVAKLSHIANVVLT